jgi:hypothetical protein
VFVGIVVNTHGFKHILFPKKVEIGLDEQSVIDVLNCCTGAYIVHLAIGIVPLHYQ